LPSKTSSLRCLYSLQAACEAKKTEKREKREREREREREKDRVKEREAKLYRNKRDVYERGEKE
jgi:hypothetical protein